MLELAERPGAFAPDFGAVVQAEPGMALDDLDREAVIALIKARGVVQFSGFRAGPEAFRGLCDRVGGAPMSYRGGGYVRRRVDPGDAMLLSTSYDFRRVRQDMFALPLHGEMYYMDDRPVLMWFCCQRPAARAGETTVADGCMLWDRLSAAARQAFRSRRIRNRRTYRDGEWQLIYDTEDPAAATAFCAGHGIEARHEPATGTLRTTYLSWAMHRPRWTAREAFINNILPVIWQEEQGRDTSEVRFEDGSRIPDDLIAELRAVAEAATFDLHWQEGDLAVVDNTRILHGRRAFDDPGREILLRMVRDVPF